MGNHMKITNPARIQTKTEFLAMSNEDIITYCSEKEGNWKKVPRERINDKVISAMIQAQPKGVVALYSFKSDMHAQHVEAQSRLSTR
jgi:LmbE family N-acetylglucosaminyl deacetylase